MMRVLFGVFVALVVFAQCTLGSTAHVRVRGVPPEQTHHYADLTGEFSCLDGSEKIRGSQVNDDYCDCEDGSDEPGTSACNAGLFYCENKGYKPLLIFKSRVNDGLRDCCDGSDEFASGAFANNCEELGAEMKQASQARIEAAKKGVQARAALIAEAPKKFDTLREELAKAEAELGEVEQQIKDAEAKLEEAEKVERAEKERLQDIEDKELMEGKVEPVAPSNILKAVDDPHTLNVGSGSVVGAGPKIIDGADNPYAGLDEEEILELIHKERDVTNNRQVDEPEQKEEENFPYPKEYMPTEAAASDEAKEEEKFPYPKEYMFKAEEEGGDDGDEDDGEDDDDEEEYEIVSETIETTVESAKSDGWPTGEKAKKKYTRTARELDDDKEDDEPTKVKAIDYVDEAGGWGGWLQDKLNVAGWHVGKAVERWLGIKVKFSPEMIRAAEGSRRSSQTSTNREAEKLRREVRTLERKQRKLKTEKERVEGVMQGDFGADNEYAHMHGECYSTEKQQYIYEVCPFGESRQKEGSSGTDLGSFDRWEVDEAGVRSMLFTGGQTCWNGPARSMTVRMSCGGVTELRDVDEPSMCVYTAELLTPAACAEADVTTLLKEYEKTFGNSEDHHVHGEL